MDSVIENSVASASLGPERPGIVNKRKMQEKVQSRRAQSLKTKIETENNNYEKESILKNGVKPKRSQSTAVRIQVTFHRPLTWQVSSSSSSSAPIPRKAGRLEPEQKVRSKVNPNNYVNINLNGNHIGTVQPPADEDDAFTFEIPIDKCEIARRNPHWTRRRLLKNAQNPVPSTSDSENSSNVECKTEKHNSSRKRLGQVKKTKSILPKSGFEGSEESEDDPTVPVVKLSFQSSKKKPKVTAGPQTLRYKHCDKPENHEKNSFDFPNPERHVSQGLHPVMTWFREPGLHVNNTDSSAMGANGSSCSHSHHGGRLKSRSQSSSALYGVKPTVNNNGGLQHQHSSQHQVYCQEENPYYNLNSDSPGRNNRYHHHHHPDTNGLSSSIPADLWDLPPSSKSYSPSRVQKQPRSNHHVEPSRKQHRIIQIPAVEALINRGKKGGRKGSTGREPIPEPHAISNRAKLYAVSCPNVAGNLDQECYDSRLPPDENDSPQIPNVISNGNGKGLHHHRSHHGSHRSQNQQQQHHHQKAWVGKQRSFEDHSRVQQQTSFQDMKCSFPIPGFPFISQDNIFELRLQRDQRGMGLGLSVTGGSDSQDSFPGLIRVKKVYPMGPAFQSGRLRPWDIILKANGVPLTGLTNHEALEVLRTTPTETVLTLCRLPTAYIPQLFLSDGASDPSSHSILRKSSSSKSTKDLASGSQSYHPTTHFHSRFSHPDSEETEPPFNSSVKSKSLSSLKIPSQCNKTYGDFEVTLEKIGGSLGFTLRQEDSSILGHYVRALVKDPALSDGRIQPGDRILSVNGQDLEGMSHADAIGFLRQCAPLVRLRFYRDPAPTPNSPLSPTESHKSIKEKTYRQEAIDMLNDLALRKQMSGSSDPKHSLPGSTASRTSGGGGFRGHSKHGQVDANGPATLPRRRAGHAGMTPSPEVLSAALDRFAGRSTPKSNQSPESSRPRANTGSSGAGLSTNYPSETRSSGSGESTPASGTIIQNRKGRAGPGKPGSLDRTSSCSDHHPQSDDETESLGYRKPSFRQYTMHLDRISSLEDESFSSDLNQNDSIVSAPGLGPSPNQHGSNFRPGQPAYQSAIVPSTRGMTRSRKNLSLSREEIEHHGIHGIGRSSRGGSDSPTALSDIDIPTSSKSTRLPSTTTQQVCRSQGEDSKSSTPERRLKHNSSSSSGATSSRPLSTGLVKWKGIVLAQGDDEHLEDYHDEDDDDDNLDSLDGSLPQRHPVVGESDGGPTSSNPSSSATACKKSNMLQVNSANGTPPLPQRQSPDGREFPEGHASMIEVSSSKELYNGEQILTVQLSRRWCSRLGFSIQGKDGHTFITAIYPDSVAGRDGRLHVGDEVIMVNQESIRNMATSEVIDMMRKTRGTISITLLRKPSPVEDADKNDSSDSQLGLT